MLQLTHPVYALAHYSPQVMTRQDQLLIILAIRHPCVTLDGDTGCLVGYPHRGHPHFMHPHPWLPYRCVHYIPADGLGLAAC